MDADLDKNALMRARYKIAIDGPAGAGKSTVAKRVADELAYTFIDTGAMYRAAALLSMREGLPLSEPTEIARVVANARIELRCEESAAGRKARVFLNGEDVSDQIRTQEVTKVVSPLSAIPAVRTSLVEQQRRIAEGGAVVLEGRDIGTVVLPDAEVKIFLTASQEERAKRRLRDFQAMGEEADLAAILKDINERDARDSSRAIAPLKKAKDAVEINTDGLTVEEVVQQILLICQKAARTCASP
ncbi:MAG TPA: (d)CMP kinase [Candidatus Obscuribacterales bacterium]